MDPQRSVVVDIKLDEAPQRHYLLPSGTPSFLYLFGTDDVGDPERTFGARLTTRDGAALAPGGEHDGARLDFYFADPGDLCPAGAAFTVWYGGVVGRGVVTGDFPP